MQLTKAKIVSTTAKQKPHAFGCAQRRNNCAVFFSCVVLFLIFNRIFTSSVSVFAVLMPQEKQRWYRILFCQEK
jgi:hypothetical protein